MSDQTFKAGDWIFPSADEALEAAEWLENDSAYLSQQATTYQEQGEKWTAGIVADNAEHSAALAKSLRRQVAAAA